MKPFLIYLALLLIKMQALCQYVPDSSKSSDSLKTAYVNYLSGFNWDGGPFFKTIFIGEHGEKKIAMIQKISLERYLQEFKKQKKDSADKIITENIVRNKAYPLKDSLLITPYFKALIINNDSLIEIEKLPIKEVIAKYFDWGGNLKREYDRLRLLLACYFFDKSVVIFGVFSTNETIDDASTKRLLGDDWYK